ncbi:MAG TPA: SUMF1/EgtB/PvdO family nonheme iron enzyme [Verrucomicrobiae bacterium]|nr:SUMF1/EgtB/PvdO family nonheme iron enzyme [Verrucomicrobiae bacterium]
MPVHPLIAACGLIAPLWMTAATAATADMVRIPAGETRIGADRGRADEQPSFVARIAAFELDRTPVTVAAFNEFARRAKFITDGERRGASAVMTFGTGQWTLVTGASWRKPEGPAGPDAVPDHPVTHVSWNDAAAFCASSGRRLPTEIEWEHAARQGHDNNDAFPFGKALEVGGRYRANVWTGVFPVVNTAADGFRTTSPVGAFGRGPLGLSDMAGNVWQWTADWYAPYAGVPARAPAPHPSPLPASGERELREKSQRGGSFLCDPKFCYGFRVTARGHATPDSSHMHVGFRCARSIEART